MRGREEEAGGRHALGVVIGFGHELFVFIEARLAEGEVGFLEHVAAEEVRPGDAQEVGGLHVMGAGHVSGEWGGRHVGRARRGRGRDVV